MADDFWTKLNTGLSNNSNALIGLGSGMLSGNNFSQGLAAGGQGFMQGAQTDDAFATTKKAEAERQDNLNQTIKFMQDRGYDDLVAAAQSGNMNAAWNEALRRSSPQAALDPTSDMQNYQFYANEEMKAGRPPVSFMEFSNSGKAPAAPSGYQPAPDGSGLTYIPGGPADPATRAAQRPPLNATIQKEIFEADETAQAGEAVKQSLDRALELNNQAYDGPFSEQRAYGSALFGDDGGKATLELKNVVTAQALDSLRATFGGMPTEGERKILLEIQGSVDQPKAVREAIYKRALAAAERRVQANLQKGNALRSGDYFDPSYTPSGASPANTTSSGLTWSIEP